MRFAINSNLMAKDSLLDKMIAGTQNINRFHLYTSCEAFGHQAEYIRDGLKVGASGLMHLKKFVVKQE